MVYVAVATDLFSDGLLVGVGSSISLERALLLALGQLLANVPEGFAAIAIFKGENTTRTGRLLLSASFVLPVLIGATIGCLKGRGLVARIGGGINDGLTRRRMSASPWVEAPM